MKNKEENKASPRAREVKKQWKLRLLKRISEEKHQIEFQKAALNELDWNLRTFEKQMDLKKITLEIDKDRVERELANFEEDKRLTGMELQDRRNKIKEQLNLKESNLKVLNKQLKNGVQDEVKKTK